MVKKEYMQPTMDVVKVQQSQMLCVSQVSVNGLGEDELIPGGSGDIGGAMAPGMTIPGLEIIPGFHFE